MSSLLPVEDFVKLFGRGFWRSIENGLVPFPAKLPSRRDYLVNLHTQIESRDYFPSLPRAYIVNDKHNRVSRIVPVFDRSEACVYFYCIKAIEDQVAVNRIDGTYGGWTLGNPIRTREDEEAAQLISPSSAIPVDTFNPAKWSENWREFQERSYQYSTEGGFSCYLKFDIANFYDTVNLNLLETKIRRITSHEQWFAVELLFHFLRNWNRQFEGYFGKTVGLPQDTTGDCSRILANFYLQDYDRFMKSECDKRKARYLRYADDQIIMADDMETARDLLFEASKELYKINLNINSSKVQEFHDQQSFLDYWAFDLFDLLADGQKNELINQAVEFFFERIDKGVTFRTDSVLRRILSVLDADLSPTSGDCRDRLLAALLDPEFLSKTEYWYFSRLASILGDRTELFDVLDHLSTQVRFNFFHYNALKFYSKYRPEYPTNALHARIAEIDQRMRH